LPITKKDLKKYFLDIFPGNNLLADEWIFYIYKVFLLIFILGYFNSNVLVILKHLKSSKEFIKKFSRFKS